MTRIDFHTNVPDKIAYACRLVRKASAANTRVVLMADDEAQLAELNTAMWTFSPVDFPAPRARRRCTRRAHAQSFLPTTMRRNYHTKNY